MEKLVVKRRKMHLWKFRSSIIEIQSEKYIVPKMSNTSTNILNGNEEIKIVISVTTDKETAVIIKSISKTKILL